MAKPTHWHSFADTRKYRTCSSRLNKHTEFVFVFIRNIIIADTNMPSEISCRNTSWVASNCFFVKKREREREKRQDIHITNNDKQDREGLGGTYIYLYITRCTQSNLERGNHVNGVQPRCYYNLRFIQGKKKISVF